MQQSKDANEDQRVKTPFQNVVMEEEQFEEDDEIHCLEDKGNSSFLLQLPMKIRYAMTRLTKNGVVKLFCKLKINADIICGRR